MYLYNNGVLVNVCPTPVHHLSVTDDGDMIRIITNPDHLEGDTVHELLATLAADYNLEPFGTWENSVEYSVCFFPEGRDWAAHHAGDRGKLTENLTGQLCSCPAIFVNKV